LRGCNVRNMNPDKAEGLSPELQRALEPLLSGIEELSERICALHSSSVSSQTIRCEGNRKQSEFER